MSESYKRLKIFETGEFINMLVLLGKFIGSLIRSLFVSIVLVVIVYSVITGDFPPSLSKAQTTWNNLHQLSQLRDSAVHRLPRQESQFESGSGEDWDVTNLENFNAERSKLAAGLLSNQKESFNPDLFNSQSQGQLQRIQELEVQLFKLQQRVNELEEKVK